MSTRIRDLPVMARRADRLEATLYNPWRRARRRLGAPLRVALPGLKARVLVLADDAWVVADQRQYHMPVIAWVEFAPQGRDGLYEPVACTINDYPFMASQLRGKVLALMRQDLAQPLSPAG